MFQLFTNLPQIPKGSKYITKVLRMSFVEYIYIYIYIYKAFLKKAYKVYIHDKIEILGLRTLRTACKIQQKKLKEY